MTNIFDPDAFMEEATAEAFDTEYAQVPAGDWTAVVHDVMKPREFTNKNGETNYVMDIVWKVMDDEVKTEVGRDVVTIKQGIYLDLTPEGKLDHSRGKNIALGKVREALGLNQPGRPFALGMLRGQGPAIVRVAHKPAKDDPNVVYANVVAVGKQ